MVSGGEQLPSLSDKSARSAEHALACIDVNCGASNGARTFRAQERYGERELIRPGLPLDRVTFARSLGAVFGRQTRMCGVVADRVHEAGIDIVYGNPVLAQPRSQDFVNVRKAPLAVECGTRVQPPV